MRPCALRRVLDARWPLLPFAHLFERSDLVLDPLDVSGPGIQGWLFACVSGFEFVRLRPLGFSGRPGMARDKNAARARASMLTGA